MSVSSHLGSKINKIKASWCTSSPLDMTVVIRGPDWVDAKVTRTSIRVEPMTAVQKQQLRHDSQRARALQRSEDLNELIKRCASKLSLGIWTDTNGIEQQEIQRSLSAKGIYATEHPEDFRQLKKELRQTRFVNTSNKAVLDPIVNAHEAKQNLLRSWSEDEHRARNQAPHRWNARSA
jgi:hypothetical protein